MVVVYPMKLKDEIIPLIELKSREEHTNKAIVLKQFLYKGLESYVIGLVSKGRLSIGKAAEILDASIYDMHEIAKSKGIKLSASAEQRHISKRNLGLSYRK
ncbi:UPF0175 family protein [Candidatus Woesearchaeota archaeon]|nr:UPF0175 family protein [Candidatus Woesearchaeota archaeon]